MGGQLAPAHNKHHWAHQQDICWFLHSDMSYEQSEHINVLASKIFFGDVHLDIYMCDDKAKSPLPPLLMTLC
jgi:hypothetical protein